MNNENGIVGIAVVWILTALSAMAAVALVVGRMQASRGRLQLDDVRALALVQVGFEMARELDFPREIMEQEFKTGRVRVERLAGPDPIVRVRCVAHAGRVEKNVVTGWRRSGERWRALYWSES